LVTPTPRIMPNGSAIHAVARGQRQNQRVKRIDIGLFECQAQARADDGKSVRRGLEPAGCSTKSVKTGWSLNELDHIPPGATIVAARSPGRRAGVLPCREEPAPGSPHEPVLFGKLKAADAAGPARPRASGRARVHRKVSSAHARHRLTRW
jgi:hypothetical protein